jgi:hypothetical protein
MSRFVKIALILAVIMCGNSSLSAAFNIPEKLNYDLTWAGIKAGESALEIRQDKAGIHLTSKAVSDKWVSIFYKVDDIVVSSLKKNPAGNKNHTFQWISQYYRIKLREGKVRRDKEVFFDDTSKKAIYINHLAGEKGSFGINDFTLDPLSCLYYVRTARIEVGKSIYMDIFDNKKLYSLEVQVVRKEEVETPAGKFKTILIKPIMQSEGIFARKGDIFIWLTDDDLRIPVMLKTKTVLGPVKAVLVSRA